MVTTLAPLPANVTRASGATAAIRRPWGISTATAEPEGVKRTPTLGMNCTATTIATAAITQA